MIIIMIIIISMSIIFIVSIIIDINFKVNKYNIYIIKYYCFSFYS